MFTLTMPLNTDCSWLSYGEVRYDRSSQPLLTLMAASAAITSASRAVISLVRSEVRLDSWRAARQGRAAQ